MITILIGTRTRSALRAAIDMAMADRRRFDVVAPMRGMHEVAAIVKDHAPIRGPRRELLKTTVPPLRVIAYAQNLAKDAFMACLNPQTDLILACFHSAKKSAEWLDELIRQEGKLEAIRVVRLGDKPSGEEQRNPS